MFHTNIWSLLALPTAARWLASSVATAHLFIWNIVSLTLGWGCVTEYSSKLPLPTFDFSSTSTNYHVHVILREALHVVQDLWLNVFASNLDGGWLLCDPAIGLWMKIVLNSLWYEQTSMFLLHPAWYLTLSHHQRIDILWIACHGWTVVFSHSQQLSCPNLLE